MSDMKHYEGTYSYTGTFKQLKDQSRLLEVTEFEYDGKYYRPSELLKFKITPQPEEGGWLSVKCEEAGVIIGGIDLEEALGNGFMMAVDQYEHLGFTDAPLTKRAQALREKFMTWEVHAIDRKAQ